MKFTGVLVFVLLTIHTKKESAQGLKEVSLCWWFTRNVFRVGRHLSKQQRL